MFVLKSVASIVFTLSGTWGALALYFQGPRALGLRSASIAAWITLAGAAAIGLWMYPLQAFFLYVIAFALLLFWWKSLKPSRDRDWTDDVARLATGQVDGSQVRLAHVRYFNWRTKIDYDVRWEAREYDLDRLRSVDLILSHWGLPGIAHTLVSFGFDDGDFVVFSVEIRKERGEAFSEIGGFFRQFEVAIIAADERDIVRLRTNVRGEDCYLYRVQLKPEIRRALFLAYIEQANRLAAKPRFYNTLTTNCTTLVYGMTARIVGDLPLDYRLLLSARLPAYIYKLGALAPGYLSTELRERGRITQRALEADHAADFSRLIRRGIPGIEAS